MKRLPILLSLFALIALSVSLAYWLLQLYQPAQRPLAAAPAATTPEPGVEAAATLFGGQASSTLVSHYQLTGVIAAGRDSVAIIVADGSAPKALKLGREIVSGVTVQEVHARYVMLSDGGVLKRIELASDTKAAGAGAASAGAQAQAEPPQFQQQASQQPSQHPSQPTQDAAPAQIPPANESAPPAATPPPPAVQMPPATRGINTGGQQPQQLR